MKGDRFELKVNPMRKDKGERTGGDDDPERGTLKKRAKADALDGGCV